MLRPYDYRNRDYDPYLGRFLRPGTIGPWGDPTNLGNAYAYVGNNPWSRLDPDGLATEEEFDARIWSGDHNELAKLPLSLSANVALQG